MLEIFEAYGSDASDLLRLVIFTALWRRVVKLSSSKLFGLYRAYDTEKRLTRLFVISNSAEYSPKISKKGEGFSHHLKLQDREAFASEIPTLVAAEQVKISHLVIIGIDFLSCCSAGELRS